jgi:hypothetical protein
VRDDEAEDCVAEELQALVGSCGGVRLVEIGGVREGLIE